MKVLDSCSSQPHDRCLGRDDEQVDMEEMAEKSRKFLRLREKSVKVRHSQMRTRGEVSFESGVDEGEKDSYEVLCIECARLLSSR